MEGKTTVAEMVDVLDPEGIGTAMRYAQGTSTLFDDVLVTPKYCPDSTHIIFCKQKFCYEINHTSWPIMINSWLVSVREVVLVPNLTLPRPFTVS